MVDGKYVLWIEGDDGTWEGVEGAGDLRFLNHSRSPNVFFDGLDLYALRDISPGEELLFDYGEDWSDTP
ncbi:MAG: SET domain-containing protein [Acidimicrobiaceae bacterium]|nr:SET domain-containing protein [Acidimicrobiaceae bacterium]MXW75575.1 SET domain-containing protein [Acidimicrobiaceae bacterium]MYA73231.1 SET domain-containing protein [Acidimicrobiaceae bacterium]MYC42627.1 SET domain-containing protein [Acidimicrobiaceae bacterium]MYD05843.1 SET domain-containing protein [Acidimicrobiaceae bacterium]